MFDVPDFLKFLLRFFDELIGDVATVEFKHFEAFVGREHFGHSDKTFNRKVIFIDFELKHGSVFFHAFKQVSQIFQISKTIGQVKFLKGPIFADIIFEARKKLAFGELIVGEVKLSEGVVVEHVFAVEINPVGTDLVAREVQDFEAARDRVMTVLAADNFSDQLETLVTDLIVRQIQCDQFGELDS
jgi:hypothetical protein